jgi:hypothetical protein
MGKHTHTLNSGNHVICDGGEKGDELRIVRKGESCRPSELDIATYPERFTLLGEQAEQTSEAPKRRGRPPGSKNVPAPPDEDKPKDLAGLRAAMSTVGTAPKQPGPVAFGQAPQGSESSESAEKPSGDGK